MWQLSANSNEAYSLCAVFNGFKIDAKDWISFQLIDCFFSPYSKKVIDLLGLKLAEQS